MRRLYLAKNHQMMLFQKPFLIQVTWNYSLMESLEKHDYKGKVYPVNAKGYSEIMGVKAFKNLLDIKDPIDVVVVTVDLKFVPDLLTECGKKNIHNMVIISGGGKELGGERAAIEK